MRPTSNAKRLASLRKLGKLNYSRWEMLLLNIASLHSLLTKSLFFICREKNATELKLKLDNEESNISAMEAEIASTLDELASIEKQSAEHKESEGAKKSQLLKQIAEAKKMADISEFFFTHQCYVITYFKQCSPIFVACFNNSQESV